MTKGGHGQESKSVRKGGHKKGKQKCVTKPMVCESMVAGEIASMCKEVLKRGRSQEKQIHKKRGALQKRSAQEIKREKAQGEGQRN